MNGHLAHYLSCMKAQSILWLEPEAIVSVSDATIIHLWLQQVVEANIQRSRS